MHQRTTAIRSLVTALSLAALTAIARPAGACEVGEEPCGTGCMPAGANCCETVGLHGYCEEGWYCWGDGQCESGTGPTKEQSIIDADGAPYGPSPERSCGIGRGGRGEGGTAFVVIAAALGCLVRRRASLR